MVTKQISVFLENKSGTLLSVLSALKDAGIQIIASTIADTAEYGIFRIICNDPEKAFDVLKKAGVAVSLCDVFAIDLKDAPGKAADVISTFAKEGISIAYLYSFLFNGKGVIIFRTDNIERAEQVIKANGFKSSINDIA